MTADLSFAPSLPDFFDARRGQTLTVLSGANNSGKSLVLKNLKMHLGETAYMVGAARFYHIHQIGTALRDPQALRNWEKQFRDNFFAPGFNYEQNYIDLNQILVGLTDAARNKYFELVGRLLGSRITLKRLEQDNDLSMRYVDIDGRNLSTSSTGTRLLMTLLGICMDVRFSTLLIDEPELGLSPRVQHALAEFLRDPVQRAEHFPHLQQVVLATHSSLFLNRRDLQANYSLSKDGSQVTLSQVQDVGEFHRLQFNLLGNSLEDMFLPTAIIIVEGPTDLAYLDRLMQLRFPDRRITVVQSNGDPKGRVAALRDTLGTLQSSPFRDRIFVVMDSVHTRSDSEKLKTLGVREENIVIWDRNGVEYVYPADILGDIFSAAPSSTGEMLIAGDNITLNGITHRKTELGNLVVGQLTSATALPDELHRKLLTPLTEAIT